MNAKSLQICGTGSGVGKSVIVAGLCRIFLQDGLKVAPFKAQNMSLNSFVTREGGEIGRAQALQAAACRLKPSVDMNPILLKPTSDTGSQVILLGRPVRNMSAQVYARYKKNARPQVMNSFRRLKENFQAIFIEGAGSPAEVNLKSHDIVNMNMARAANAPVILVGDIDRGGVFAWLIGTWGLLTKSERKRVKGFIINKFRGDKQLLKSGLDFLERKTGVKVLGVIPYFKDIKIPDEDSMTLDFRTEAFKDKQHETGLVKIGVVRLPHISNFTDFDSLKNEPAVSLRYTADKDGIKDADIIILPGTKNTIADLAWLKKNGIADFMRAAIQERHPGIIGICGGYQMLGRSICDPERIESDNGEMAGLNILPIVTTLKKEKVLAEVRAKHIQSGLEVSGYEIHHGNSQNILKNNSMFRIFERQGKRVNEQDGVVSEDGRIWGTYIHGVFDNDAFRGNFLNNIRLRKGLKLATGTTYPCLDGEIDKLADILRKNLDIAAIRNILFGKD